MQLAIYDPITNVMLADWSTRIKSCGVRTGAHGYESCEADLDVPFYEAFLYYQQLGPLKLRVTWGSYRIWEGRLEDPTQFTTDNSNGLKLTAFGGWVAFNDAPIVALWSDTKFDGWLIVDNTEFPGIGITKEMYANDLQNRIFFGLQKGAVYLAAAGGSYGMAAYKIPHLSTRNIVGISFDLTTNLPDAWQILVQTRDSAYGSGVTVATFTCTGALLTRSFNLTFTGNQIVDFLILNNAVGTYTMAGESGSLYASITNVRLVTSIANRVNTTLSAARAAGVNVTASVVSTARMFVGQKLQIKSAGNPSETVTVLSIGGATAFNATFVGSYANGDAVQAHLIYPDEIIEDCVTTLNTLNSTQVSSDVAKIQSQAVDIDQAIYEDVYPTDIINQLLAKSDDQTPPRQWVGMVFDNQQLIIRPRGSGLAWYTDITSLEVVRTLIQLYNSVYVVYSDVSNKRALRTANTTDADSVDKFKITRRKPVKVDTTDNTQATKVRDSVLDLQTDPVPRASIELDRIYDKFGNPFPLFMVKADDTLTIRNLPPVLGTVYDKIRTLVIVRTNVDLIKNTLQLDLETATPNIEVQLAQALKGTT